MNKPTLSVLMPNYNHGHYLRESIPAILNQSYQPLEFIIVDDGSTDDSVEFIESLSKKNDVIHLVKHKTNKGNYAAFARALSLCKGDFFIATAADDMVLPGLFEKTMNMLSKYPDSGLCSSISRRIDENGNELATAPEPPYISKVPCYLPPEKVLQLYIETGGDWCMPSTVIWNTKAVKESKAFDIKMGNFADILSLQMITLNYGACFIPEPLGLYRVVENSFSKEYRSNPKAYMDLMESSEKVLQSDDYRDKFPSVFLGIFHSRALYQRGAISLQNWQSSTDECYEHLEKSLPVSSMLNRVVFAMTRVLGKAQIILLKLFLFLRTRRISWYMIRRVLGRFNF